MAQLYIATQAFMSNRHGREVWIAPSQIAEAGSWVLKASPDSFRPLVIDYPAPGSKLQAQKPPQRHPEPSPDENPSGPEPSPPPDGGQVAQTDGRKLPPVDNDREPAPTPPPDSGTVAHAGDKPEQRTAPKQPARGGHRSRGRK